MKFDLSFDPNGRTRVNKDVSIIISQMHNAAIVHTQQSAQLFSEEGEIHNFHGILVLLSIGTIHVYNAYYH